MKNNHNNIVKKHKIKPKNVVKNKKQQIVIVAQEIKFARLLSGNEKKTRDRVLKTLKKWLGNCFEKNYEFKEDDFIRVWKGIFYAVWMSDKPLIQEELCENIASILDMFPPEHLKYAMMMSKAGFKVLATEWYGIDQHRIDKFMMLVRRYLRGSLRCLLRCEWSLDSCEMFAQMLSGTDGLLAPETPYYARNASSMIHHILDCYLEEIAKVSSSRLPPESLAALLRPVCALLCGGGALALAARRLLDDLMRSSEPGLRYQHATRHWLKMGCPRGGPEALELVSDDEQNDDDDDVQQNGHDVSEDEDNSPPLDPRAGRVSVVLSALPVPAARLADSLEQLLAKVGSGAHRRVKLCMERFRALAGDSFPLRMECVSAPGVGRRGAALGVGRRAHALARLEAALRGSADELALKQLSKKHRKRLLSKSREGLSIAEDVQQLKENSTATGAWQVETTEPVKKKIKLNNANKENQQKSKKNIKLERRNTNNIIKDKKKKIKVVNTNGEVKKLKMEKQEKNVKQKDIKDQDSSTKLEDSKKIHKNIPQKLPNTDSDKVLTGFNIKFIKKTKSEGIVLKDKKINTNGTKPMINRKIEPQASTKKPLHKQQKLNKVINSDVFDQMTPKKVKFVLKNNSMQKPVDYYKSVRQSPSIPFDGTKKPVKTNLKVCSPSPINPFFKKKLKLKK